VSDGGVSDGGVSDGASEGGRAASEGVTAAGSEGASEAAGRVGGVETVEETFGEGTSVEILPSLLAGEGIIGGRVFGTEGNRR
jgi:hypothetical protein